MVMVFFSPIVNNSNLWFSIYLVIWILLPPKIFGQVLQTPFINFRNNSIVLVAERRRVSVGSATKNIVQ